MRESMGKTTKTEQTETGIRSRLGNILENLFVVVLAFYPLRHIGWGLDLWDTGYNYANFQYMGTEHMDPMWLFSTYLSNAMGNLLTKLPNAGNLWGMNLYTGLFVSLLALTGFFFCYKVLKMPAWIAFLGEFLAVSLCWCPTALLYNYLTYVLFLVCVILLYRGLTGEKKWCLFVAGVCLGANVLVRFSNLPEAALILAVWAYDIMSVSELEQAKPVHSERRMSITSYACDIILWRESRKADAKEQREPRFWPRLCRHTLWCLLGYLAALVVLLGYIQIRYGLDQYVAGIARLLSMTDKATDYKATAMLMGMINTYVENLYWVIRIGVIVLGGMILLMLSGWVKAGIKRFRTSLDDSKAKKLGVGERACMGLLSLVIAAWLSYRGFWTQLLNGNVSIRQAGMLLLILIMLIALAYCVGERVFAALLGIAMLGWLYLRGFCSLYFYSYDPILRPGVLFLMLTMLIALIRIFHPGCPKEEKLISSLLLLVVLLTSIGSNNGIYPSLNNLFAAAPYTLWQSWRFLQNVGEKRIGKIRLSSLPVKGVLTAFLLLCLFQFSFFGVNFVFAEATGVQDADNYVENNEVLENIRMSADKALWLTEISEYVDENGLQGQEVILYGRIPALSYYLQMPSAFNPWSDLDSYSVEQMALDLESTTQAMEQDVKKRPVIILEREYMAYLSGGVSALEELGVGEKRIDDITEDQKWPLLFQFMEAQGYVQDFSNGKFTVYR